MKSMKTLKRMGDSRQLCLTSDKRGNGLDLMPLSPYACIAVSVVVLDQVHQVRVQATSPKNCPQCLMVDEVKRLKSTNAACMGASYCQCTDARL